MSSPPLTPKHIALALGDLIREKDGGLADRIDLRISDVAVTHREPLAGGAPRCLIDVYFVNGKRFRITVEVA